MSRPDGFIHLFYQNGLPVMVGYQGHYRQWLRHARVLLAERLKGWQGYLLAVDDNGSVLKGLTAGGEDAAHRFTAYGHGAWQPSACTQAGFKGERLDAVTRGYFLGNGYRLHMPTLMRFNAPDSLSPFNEGGLNAYAYCGGDPINHEDPSGHAFGFRIRTRGYRTSFNAALRRRPAARIDIPGKLASHADHLFNNVLDYLPSDALENLSKANPAFEPIIAKRSSRNLDVFMQTLKFEGLQPTIENPPVGVRRQEANERLQTQISRNVRPEIGAYLGLFGNTLDDLPAAGRKIRDT
ncbi:RHS repeat-associated core domain protein [Pseudomonas putida S610]|uniref:RHS repeat-associated core domain-containing protein n=1 Tax=Pseudomonas putida TaxID=303 RepID=UPI0003C5FE94|nr:RHS repeat-associated core domain-containing protein [Pseudomonas putida]EST17767.1 RHS repeat-associated core domain protein [Pseudomonas putida S610]